VVSTTDSILKRIEVQATKRTLPIIGPDRSRILEDVVKKHSPRRVLEIGTLVGYSSIRIARLLPAEGELICLEKDAEIAKEARENLAEAGLDGRVDLRVGDALDLIPKLTGKFDLVFIDAAKDEYLRYLTALENRLRKGSVVVADNVKRFASEMQDYLEYVRASGMYRSSYHEDPKGLDAIEVSVKL
jgi:predicted O-methyltransferase YrrM